LGFTYSIVPGIAVASGIVFWVFRSRTLLAGKLRTLWGVAIAACLYLVMAWLYVFELPVPSPRSERLESLLGDLKSTRFEEFYDVGYRIGILSTGALPDYYFGRSEGVGLSLGLAFGEREWRQLFPPITESAAAAVP
jgi:hypothetical protein